MGPAAETLRDLIEKAMVKHDTRSLRALARIGKENGGELSHNTLAAIRNGDYKAERPGRRVLQEIADLAGVSYETAHRAAGLGTPGRPFAKQLPERVDELTPKHRDVALVVIRALLDAQTSANSAERVSVHSDVLQDASDAVAYVTESDYEDTDGLLQTDEPA